MLWRALRLAIDARPVPVLENELDIVESSPLKRRRVEDAQAVASVERSSPKLTLLDPGLRQQRLIRAPDRKRDEPLGSEGFSVIDLPCSEIEVVWRARPIENRNLRGIVREAVL